MGVNRAPRLGLIDTNYALRRRLPPGAPATWSAHPPFGAYLREHYRPVTARCLAIAELILAAVRHLSANEVLCELKARKVKASTATVYRTLELLVRRALLVERDFAEGFKRVERAHDIPHHEHLIGSTCGYVREPRDERLERMNTLMAEARGTPGRGATW